MAKPVKKTGSLSRARLTISPVSPVVARAKRKSASGSYTLIFRRASLVTFKSGRRAYVLVKSVHNKTPCPPATPGELPRTALTGPISPPLSGAGVAPSQPVGRRPFVGYDRERAAYSQRKPELLKTAEGKYIVLVGDDMVGPVNSYGEALREGYRRFGGGPLYIKQVLVDEPVAEVSRDVTPCRL